MEDRQIVDLFWARNEAAIDETKSKYGRYCRYIAHQILASDEDAAEVENDTYMKTWNTVPPNRPTSLKAYVGRISRQLSLDRWDMQRAAKRGGGTLPLVLEELSECVAGRADTGDLCDRIALRDAMERFLRGLPKRTRTIFIRRYWYVSSIEQIARDYAMKESAVAMLLLRTREKLKSFLRKEGFVL